MRTRTFYSLALPLLVFARSAQATSLSIDPSIATATAIAPGAMIEDDLSAHTWVLHPTVGYFTGSTTVDGSGSTSTSHGFGETVEGLYSFSDHLGVNFSGLNYNGSGTYTPGTGLTGATQGDSSVSGWLVGAALVLDPLSGDGFRMPFFVGLNFEHINSSTPTSPTVTSLSLNSPGYTTGLSPRFNIGFLRLEPFLVVTTPTSKGNVTCSSLVVSGVCGAASVQILPVFGVNIVFRPWNLSFYFNLSSFLFGTGVSFYSVGPQLRF